MAGEQRSRRRRSWIPRWLRQRALITGEALLLVGVVQQLIQSRIAQLPMPNWAKVAWVMVSTLGVLSVLMVYVRILTRHGVAKAHQVVGQSLPVPAPFLLAHLCAYAGLFLLYAKIWDLPLW